MAILINGNGNLAIYAQQDADWYAALMGGQTVITAVGNQFAYELLASNTIGVKDGVIITSEGRRIQLDANAIDSFDIPTGAQGTTNYYIIGYHLVTGNQSEQTCETFVQLMENGTDTIPEGSFRDGDDEVFVSLYRVEQDDLTIGTITLLLPQLSGSFQSQISQLNNDLTANSNHFYFDYHDGKYGYNTSAERGADTFTPFKKGGAKLIGTYYSSSSINISSYDDTNISHYLAVASGYGSESARTYTDPNGNWASYGHARYTPPSISISGNTLYLTPASINAKTTRGSSYTDSQVYSNTSNISTKLYYVGEIS